MFIHNINPILAQIGPISIRYYGLVYALGFLFTYLYLLKKIKNKKIKLTIDELDSLLIYLILGVIIGGRIGEFIFFQPTTLINNPLEIIYIWHGGMSFHGGLIGVLGALILFSKKHKKQFYEILDNLLIPLSIVLIFGRLANFINGELVGTITTISWGVNFHNELNTLGERIYRHPSQIYEAIKNLILATTLILMSKLKITKKYYDQKGFITWTFMLIYGLGRTITDIWRDDGHWLFGIFSTGQLLSMIMTIIAIYVLITKYFKKKRKENNKKRKKN